MSAPEILVIDNYDSFVYNLVQYLGEAVQPTDGAVTVRRNDAVDVPTIRELDPDGIVVSPGPGTPAEAGVSMDVFDLDYPTLGVCLGHQALCARNGAPVGHADAVVHGKPSRISHDGEGVFDLDYPTFGVCLGHQALCARNGAPVGHADAVVHGKPSRISHDGEGVFDGLPQGIRVGRYHSLAVDRDAIPDELVETATTDDEDVVMAVRHREKPHVGVQFHPESILTEHGKTMIRNFLGICREWEQ